MEAWWANNPSIYDMENDPLEYWEFWKANHKPEVWITYVEQSVAHAIPSDAIIAIADCGVTLEFLNAVSHVKDVTCCQIYDFNAAGYRGSAKIESIVLTDPTHFSDLPDCDMYEIIPAYKFGHLDCKGRVLNALCIKGRDSGFFEKVAKYFTNFGEIRVMIETLQQLHREAPEIIATPGMVVCLIVTHVFDISLIAGIYIENLALSGRSPMFIKHDPDADLCFGNLVRYSKCFQGFVESISMRFKKTKRCVE